MMNGVQVPGGSRSPGRWRKSSYSGNNGNCVEIGVVELHPAVGGWRKSSYSSNGGDCVEIGVAELHPAAGGWRKSSHSDGNGGDCVEVSVTDAGQVPGGPAVSAVRVLAVRDSKEPAGPRLHFAPGAWVAFAGALKAGSW